MLGKAIGRYEILSELGRGANGVVWKARHSLLPDRLVALKVLSDDLWSSKQARDRFLREAIAVSRLDHPGIATLYDAEEVEGQLYIAFKLVEGGTVAHRTEEGPMPLREAVNIGRDAAEALAHAHAHGVIHRDLSPGNIMVNRDGRGVLVDFGLARAGEQSATATTGVVVGTLAYMPPEILRGEAADARSDIYSLGAVLYRMITGRAPFEGVHAEGVVFQILNSRPVPPSAVNSAAPPELDDVVLRALERNPHDRYANAIEMARALGDALERPGLREGAMERISPGSRLMSRVRRALRRRPSSRAVALSGVSCALLAGLGIAWTMGWVPVFTARKPVVAVLPTRNLSEDPTESAYLSEAFGEALVTRLGQVSSVRMVPWLTTQRFTDPKQRLEAVGRELRADKLVVGSYRSDGDRVQVTVALVDARTGLQSWSQAYEERVEDIFALQRGVATGIASHLGARLSDAESHQLGVPPSKSPQAYEFYLRGAVLMNSEDSQQIAMAGPFFEQALKLDPDLAVAAVGLGAVKTDLYFRGQGGLAGLDEAELDFRRALSLDPKLHSAVWGLIRVAFEHEIGRDERILRLWKSLNVGGDDAEALLVRGVAYTLAGLPDKAISILDRVLELDPGSQAGAFYRVLAESWAGEPELATTHAKAYLRKFGEDPEIYHWLGLSLYLQGEKSQARLCFTRILELFGENPSNTYSVWTAILLYRELGERARADSLAEHWLGLAEARSRANPDNERARGAWSDIALLLGVGGRERILDSLLVAAENPPVRAGVRDWAGIYLPSGFFAMADVPRIRRAFRASLHSPVLDTGWFHSGSLHLQLGERYSVVEKLPEFRAYLAAVQRRHDELAARY